VGDAAVSRTESEDGVNFSFIRIAHAVARHPKFLRTPSAAKWLWVLGIIYSQEVESDGFIPRAALPMLGYVESDVVQAATQLVQVGLWVEVEDGFTIHDYLDYNYSAAQIEQLRTTNRINGSKGGMARAKRSEPLGEPPAEPPSEMLSEGPKQIRSDPIRSVPRNVHTHSGALVQRRRANAAFEGTRVWVPQQCHQNLIQLLNKPDAARELLLWYAAVDLDWSTGAHKEAQTGAEMFKFWQARFDERWPPAQSAVGVRGSKTTGNAAAIRSFVGGSHDS
jgi:hypothetical protein